MRATLRGLEYVCLTTLALVISTATASAQTQIDVSTFAGLRVRPIGPAVMSGRIAAVDAVAEDPITVYVGSASGGVWKSKDAGISFQPIFDEHTQSIGAIKIDPSSSDIVWVGTGESWTRNSVSVGTGVYKSVDAGDSWQHVGLAESERIARIAIDSRDGSRVFVCATGHLWDGNPERGVYRTQDGGETWERVLFVDENTGCSDIAIDPQDPRIIYAGMWQVRRWPWFFESGGPGSGLYRSTDGGDSWEELSEGLPTGEKGRIAVAVAPSRPNVVYALVEAEETALYRSDDLGESWRRVNTSSNIQARPFYFAHIVVDPIDFERIYKPGLFLTVSVDGGTSFSSPFIGGGSAGAVHSDHHALWINPNNPNELILGTDGGVYFSYDRGAGWRLSKALPVSQFYEISYDMAFPYNVYGGLQDNGTWMGPSRSAGGIEARDWDNIGGGDGFHVFVDPRDPDFVYVEYQGGRISRRQLSTGEVKSIRAYAGEGEPELRFNWNTPIHVSPSRLGTIYVGAQYLLRSTDRGDSWERISPDLTTNDPGKQRQGESGGLSIDNSTAENHTTIYTISESPLDADVIWVGTDDGNLQVTHDGGASWNNVVGRIAGLPAGTWVSHVEASRHAEGTAYVTFDGHRTGDMATYVYRTTDFGSTWSSLVTESLEGYAHVVKEDLENDNLLFLGTEFGLFISIDGGRTWTRFETEFPKVAVHDLAIHPREHDLIIGTHGRGIWILDDVTPLRGLTPELLEADLALLPTRPAVMTISGGLQQFPGGDEFVGLNPPEAASIVYYQKKRHIFGDLKVEISNPEGQLITTLPGGKLRGINRVNWPMRLPPPKIPPATTLVPAATGPRVPEGSYTYRIIKGSDTYEGQVSLVPDPRSTHSAEDRRLQQRTALQLYDMLERLTYVVDATIDLRDQARDRANQTSGGTARRLGDYADELDEFRKTLVATSEAGWVSGEEKLRENLGELYGGVNGYAGRPTESELGRMQVLEAELERAVQSFDQLVAERRIRDLNTRLERAGLEPLVLLTREAWETKRSVGS